MRIPPFVLLAILLFTPSARADADSRTIVDRLVRAAHWNKGDTDLTAMGCALLDRPEKEVIAALAEAMERELVRGSVASRYGAEIESLTRLVVGSDKPAYRHLPFRVVAGTLVRVPQGGGDGGHSTPGYSALEEFVDGPPRVRLKLGLNPKRILAFILEPEARPTWSSDSGLARDLGRSLGQSVASDKEFSERLVGMLRARCGAKESGPAKRTTGALMAAVAFGPIRSAEEVLLGMVRAGWNDFDSLALLRSAGRFEVLANVRKEFRKSKDPDADFRFRFSVGGDFTFRPLLEAARKSPNPHDVRRFASSVAVTMYRVDPGLFRDVLAFALDLAGSEDESLRAAARNLLNGTLWPGQRGTSTSRDRKATGVGGYPDPIVLGRRVRKDLETGKIALLPRGFRGPGIFSDQRDYRFTGHPRPGRPHPVSLVPRRDGDEVVVTITNRMEEAVCLNRTAFRYATGEITRTLMKGNGKRVWVPGVDLEIGVVLCHAANVCRREDYAVLAPGEALTIRYPLAADFSAEGTIGVAFRDWSDPPEGLIAPRVAELCKVLVP